MYHESSCNDSFDVPVHTWVLYNVLYQNIFKRPSTINISLFSYNIIVQAPQDCFISKVFGIIQPVMSTKVV